jgi:hypothetical protein
MAGTSLAMTKKRLTFKRFKKSVLFSGPKLREPHIVRQRLTDASAAALRAAAAASGCRR